MARRKDTDIYSYKLKKGGTSWGFKVYVGRDPETGKAMQVSRQGYSTYKEARQAKIDILAGGVMQTKKERKQRQAKKTVSDVWKIWSEIYRQDVGDKTFHDTEDRYKFHIEPKFGDVYVAKMSVDRVQKFVNDAASNYVSYKKIIGLLKRLIKYAMLRDWATKNPFDRVVIPKKSKQTGHDTKDNFFDDRDKVLLFLATAKKISFKIYTYYMLLLNLGLRRGEGLALKWSDFDFDAQTVHIQRTVTTDKQGHKKIGPPKTPKSDRTILLSKNLLEVLQEYKKQEEPLISDYVIHRTGKDDYYSGGASGNWLKRIYKKNPSLKQVSTHGLRHTYATLIYAGDDEVKPKDVQFALGHSKADEALDIYTHITENNKKNIRKSIDNLDFK